MKLPRVAGAVAAWQFALRCSTTSRGCACWSRCTRGISPPSHGSSGSLSGPGRNRRWEVLQAKWSCCSADRRRRCESCDGFPPSLRGGGGLQVDLLPGKERVKSPSPGAAAPAQPRGRAEPPRVPRVGAGSRAPCAGPRPQPGGVRGGPGLRCRPRLSLLLRSAPCRAWRCGAQMVFVQPRPTSQLILQLPATCGFQ